ncbi:Alcohol dehydrogenase-like 7 [Linum grandiflorum]
MDSSAARGSTAGKPIRCKVIFSCLRIIAAVCRKAGEPLAIEEVMVDPPRIGEARIRIICTSVCNTDVSFWRMKDSPGGNFPIILGHEGFGVVESVGEGVEELKQGDRVIPIFLPDCGDQCEDCRSSKSNLCSKLPFKISPWMPRDDTSRFRDLEGNVIHHFLSVSSLSEYTVVDVTHLTKVDDSSLAVANRACLLTCGISAGKKFGLTEFVNPTSDKNKPLSQVIKEMTDGGGADYCFECAGSPVLMEQAYASARKGWGKTVVLGVGGEGSEMKLKCMEVLQSGKTLTGALFGGLKPKSDIPVLLKRYMDKELELDKFVMEEMELKDINKAFDLLLQGNCLRCVIWSALMATSRSLTGRTKPLTHHSFFSSSSSSFTLPSTTRIVRSASRVVASIGSVDSLIPFHTATANSRLISSLAADSSCWSLLSEALATPL